MSAVIRTSLFCIALFCGSAQAAFFSYLSEIVVNGRKITIAVIEGEDRDPAIEDILKKSFADVVRTYGAESVEVGIPYNEKRLASKLLERARKWGSERKREDLVRRLKRQKTPPEKIAQALAEFNASLAMGEAASKKAESHSATVLFLEGKNNERILATASLEWPTGLDAALTQEEALNVQIKRPPLEITPRGVKGSRPFGLYGLVSARGEESFIPKLIDVADRAGITNRPHLFHNLKPGDIRGVDASSVDKIAVLPDRFVLFCPEHLVNYYQRLGFEKEETYMFEGKPFYSMAMSYAEYQKRLVEQRGASEDETWRQALRQARSLTGLLMDQDGERLMERFSVSWTRADCLRQGSSRVSHPVRIRVPVVPSTFNLQ